jgi:hypothetical protein
MTTATGRWRFSVDENLPRELAARLRAVGYGTEHVIDVGRRGHSDAGVYAYAQAEGATVVTIWAMTLGRLLRRGHCRWMLPMPIEETAEVHHAVTIEQERINRRGSSRGETNDESKVVAPCEVCVPTVMAWMIQRHEPAAGWVARLHLVVLVIVAALTGQREVVGRRPTFGARQNVLNREGLGRILRLAAAVLAATAGALNHALTQLCTAMLLRHRAAG